ncbi:hypothetical protein [Nocardioides sp.]|uniref:hypothetical protein n=1 Tax=Nocardioides sp. TaxID=35761 RepID=UPI0026061F08|nr:hypothetical protein [Nocardioides sp.]MCW2736102.1 hypothetical protein [Nocardioides sp.]
MTPEKIDRIAQLLIIDLLLQGSARYWLKRADDFAAVGTPACDEIARACRNKAVMCRSEDERNEWVELLALELGDVA